MVAGVQRVPGHHVLHQSHRLFHEAQVAGQPGGESHDVRIRRCEVQRLLVMPRRGHHVALMVHRDVPKVGVSFGVVRIDGQGPIGSLVRQSISLVEWQQVGPGLKGVGSRQPGPGRGIFRVDGQGVAIQRHRPLERLGRALVAQLAGLQIQGVCLGIGRFE